MPKFFELRLERVPLPQFGQSGLNNDTRLDNGTFDSNLTDVVTVADLDVDGGGVEGVDYEMQLVPTWLRKDKTYVRVYLIWMNLFIQVREQLDFLTKPCDVMHMFFHQNISQKSLSCVCTVCLMFSLWETKIFCTKLGKNNSEFLRKLIPVICPWVY